MRTFDRLRPMLARSGLDRRAKYAYESIYWRTRHAIEGRFDNHWYEDVYTRWVGLDREWWAGRRILDVGCGPRGSLEWAHDATTRVGLDPLTLTWHRLGGREHAMVYVAAAAEAMPFHDASFDVVTSVNSLDHVDDLDATIAEITRVLAPGGLFLLVVEIDHEPTIAEPHRLGWDLTDRFLSDFALEREQHFEYAPRQPGVVPSLEVAIPFDHDHTAPRSGTLHLQLRRH